MGIFDKIGDVLGDIVDGVVDFVDDVFNIDLKKVFSNDIVRYGLMAVSVFTGGVAIANGVMTGFSQATAAKGFMSKFVEGASGFVKGALDGLMNPLDTAQGIGEQVGLLQPSGPAAAVTGGPSNASQIVDNLSGTGPTDSLGVGGQAFDAGGEALANSNTGLSLTEAAQRAGGPELSSAQEALNMDPSQAAMDSMTGGPADVSAPGFDPAAGAAPAAPGVSAPSVSAPSATADKGFFGRVADGLTDFAASPAGLQTLTGMASGWAEGQMIQERWDEINRRDDERRRSWTEGQWAPRAAARIPTLAESRDLVQRRGNEAQAKYGY